MGYQGTELDRQTGLEHLAPLYVVQWWRPVRLEEVGRKVTSESVAETHRTDQRPVGAEAESAGRHTHLTRSAIAPMWSGE